MATPESLAVGLAASAPVIDRTVALRDGAVQVRVRQAGHGRPLLYFHSVHERGGWSPFLDHLARSRTVYAPFHPGVGGSTGVETLDDLLDLTLVYDELGAALGLGAADLVGHAFGAMAAAELAAVFPACARRLALLSPIGLWRDERPSADVLVLPHEDLMVALWGDPDSAPARAWATLPATEAENVEAQLESIARRAAMARFVWPIPDKGIARRLHRVAAPTLVLWGEEDRANPVAYADDWRARLARATVRRLPGGHMLHHERPESAAAVVVEFLDR